MYISVRVIQPRYGSGYYIHEHEYTCTTRELQLAI